MKDFKQLQTPLLPPWMLSPFRIPAFLSLLQCEERDLAAGPNRNASLACSPLPQSMQRVGHMAQEGDMVTWTRELSKLSFHCLTWLPPLGSEENWMETHRDRESSAFRQWHAEQFPTGRWIRWVWIHYGLVESCVLWVLNRMTCSTITGDCGAARPHGYVCALETTQREIDASEMSRMWKQDQCMSV